MKGLFLVALLFVVVFTQYDNTLILTSDCTMVIDLDGLVGYRSSPMNAITCVPSCTQVGSLYYNVNCDESSLPDPPTPEEGQSVIYEVRWGDDFCGATGAEIIGYSAILADVCIDQATLSDSGISSSVISCKEFITWDSSGCSAGNGTDTVESHPGSDACYLIPVELGGGSARSDCLNNVCFHEKTEITYETETLTMKALEKRADCAIPHVVLTDGVKITTSCDGELRLTNDHLVYTQDGVKAAASVKAGDFLYNDLAEKTVCEVLTVETERGQRYFGLNCEESIVLANGYKTSTFGVTHDLPALWMRFASKVFGIYKASTWGDMVASILYKWKLI